MSNDMLFLDARVDDEEIPAWKRLDIALRKMATLTQHEKDLENYEKIRQEWQ
jgi:hypothetical protein